MWADRLLGKSLEEKVQMHVDRWSAWDAFISYFADGRKIYTEIDEIKIKGNDEEKRFQLALDSKKVRWSKKRVESTLFDASFGSLNSTSDLDINVLSTDSNVLVKWIQYLKIWQSEHPGNTFTNYYDSNFYFEPCDANLQSFKALLVYDHFAWTNSLTYRKEFETVKAYTDAYERKSTISGISPNPEGMNASMEILYYRKMIQSSDAFRNAVLSKNQDAIRESYLDFAICKIEGIVNIPALVICGVFGDVLMKKYMNKEVPIYPKALEIAVYEMLRNLRMHAHKDGELYFKSKYANRLINLLKNDQNICEKNDIHLEKTNEATLQTIKPALVFLLDYMDGNECHLAEYKNIKYDLDKVIDTLEKRILGDSTRDSRDLVSSVSALKLRF